MKKKNAFYLGVVIFLTLALWSCEKDSPNGPEGESDKIIKILGEVYDSNGKKDDDILRIDFEYDEKERISTSKVLINGVVEYNCDITFEDNQIKINWFENNHFTVLKLNEKNYCNLLEEIFDGEVESKADCSYDKNGYLINVTETYKNYFTGNNATENTAITWVDGNISEITYSSGKVVKYKYSTHKNNTFMHPIVEYEDADFHFFAFQSWMGKPVKNLVSEVTEYYKSSDKTYRTFLEYELNPNGTVAVCTVRDSYGYYKMNFFYE